MEGHRLVHAREMGEQTPNANLVPCHYCDLWVPATVSQHFESQENAT